MEFQYVRNRFVFQDFSIDRLSYHCIERDEVLRSFTNSWRFNNLHKAEGFLLYAVPWSQRAFASLLILLFVYLKCYQRRLPGQCSDPSEDAAASAGMALCCTVLAGTQLLTAVSHQLPELLVPKIVWNVRGHEVYHTLERRSSQLSFLHKGKWSPESQNLLV